MHFCLFALLDGLNFCCQADGYLQNVLMSHSPSATIHRFGNGLTLLVREERAHPAVSVQFWVRTGSCDEGRHLGAGLSHLLEHMVFKGTRNLTGRELAEQVQERGGLWNAYTSSDRTVYHIDGPSGSWRNFLELLTELVFHPSFPVDELEKEKEVIRREMAMYGDDPDAETHRLLMETLYKRSPRRFPVLGLPASFDLLTQSDMMDYHRERYRPNNAFVVVSGDVSATDVIAALEQFAGDLVPGAMVEPPAAVEPPQWGRRVARREFPVPYSKLVLGWRMPPRHHPDIPALAMLSRILGSGRSARLYRSLHDELGLVHDVSSSLHLSPGTDGVLTVAADVDRDKRDQVAGLIADEIERLAGEDLGRDLGRAVKRARAGRIQAQATVSGLADELAMQWFHFGNPDYQEEWLEAFEAVSQADVARVVQTWLGRERLTEVSLDPPGSNGSDAGAGDVEGLQPIRSLTLENGLRVVLRRESRLPVVHGCIALMAGPCFENPRTAGVTAMLAECLLKGTQKRSAEDIAEYLEDLGGAIDSSSGNNSMYVRFHTLAEDLEAGLELLADVVLRPMLPDAAVSHEREAMISDAQERLEDPLCAAFDTLNKTAYGDQTYGLPPHGTVENLPETTSEQLWEHYRKLAVAGNAVISLAGDFDEETAIGMIEKHFGAMTSGNAPRPSFSPALRAGEALGELDKEQAVLVMGLPGIDVRSGQRAHASLLDAWCSDMAGPVFTGIREEAGLAYYASSTLFMGLDTGMILFYLGTSPARLAEARARLEEILGRIAREGMSEGDLERTRASALSAQLLARQSAGTISRKMALDVLYGLPADSFERMEEEMRCLTLDEMNAFIRDCLAASRPRVWSLVCPENS